MFWIVTVIGVAAWPTMTSPKSGAAGVTLTVGAQRNPKEYVGLYARTAGSASQAATCQE